MSKPFKMKGSPMKRNFGISPVKHGDTPEPHTKYEEGKKQSEDYNESMDEIYEEGGYRDKGDMLTANIINTSAYSKVDEWNKSIKKK
tara:strand:- start:88 stop:348 length:261 start_codon:yes stop_codon:yes gene_type:complete